MGSGDLKQSIITFLKSKNAKYRYRKIQVDGGEYLPKDLVNYLRQHAQDSPFTGFVFLSGNEQLLMCRDVTEQFQSVKDEEDFDITSLPEGIFSLGTTSAKDLKHISLGLNFETGELIAYDNEQQTYSDVKPRAIELKYPPKQLAEIKKNLAICKLRYAPYEDVSIEEFNVLGSKGKIINTYRAPSWREVEEPNPNVPAMWWDFFKHLFPVESEREYVFSWIHYLLVSRNHCFLYLTGAQGTGKNTFAEFCSKLIGKTNYHLGKSDFTTNSFNSYLENSQLMFLDEFRCKNHADRDELKKLTNDELSIEAKGVDQKVVRNHCNFIIANNNPGALLIHPEDRRFSIPHLTEVNILNKYGYEWMSNLYASMEDDEVMASLGHFFTNYAPTHTPHDRLQNEYFFDIVKASVGEVVFWLIYFFSTSSVTKITYDDLRKHYGEVKSMKNTRNIFPGRDYLKLFFTHYLISGAPVVKEIYEEDGDVVFKLNEVNIEDIE